MYVLKVLQIFSIVYGYNYYNCAKTILYCTYFFKSQLFKLIENYEVDPRILKCDFIRYSPAEKSTINTLNSQLFSIYLEKIVLLIC